MRWEEQIACEHFRNDAADGPHITRIFPIAALKDNFRRSILPGVDDGAMSFLGMRRPSKIYKFDLIRSRQHVTRQP